MSSQNIRIRLKGYDHRLLDQSALQMFPLLRRYDAGHEIKREDALRTLGIPVDVKRDALAQKRQIDGMAFGDALETGVDVNVVARMTADCQKGIARFLKKE